MGDIGKYAKFMADSDKELETKPVVDSSKVLKVAVKNFKDQVQREVRVVQERTREKCKRFGTVPQNPGQANVEDDMMSMNSDDSHGHESMGSVEDIEMQLNEHVQVQNPVVNPFL